MCTSAVHYLRNIERHNAIKEYVYAHSIPSLVQSKVGMDVAPVAEMFRRRHFIDESSGMHVLV